MDGRINNGAYDDDCGQCGRTDEAGTSRISELENQLETTEQSLAAERAAKNALAN